MKYEALTLIRSLGVLRPLDAVAYLIERLRVAGQNREFLRDSPGFTPPPYDLAFDAFHHCNWRKYHDVGLCHATVFARLIRQSVPRSGLAILEWGCGPGRLIRHMPELLEDCVESLVGSDYNPRSVEWCRAQFPGMDFVHNGAMPPLPFSDGHFDAVYCFSVFTHLSEAAQRAWAVELHRVIKAGGVLICTTHGDNYRYLLTSKKDRMRYDAGEITVQARYGEGKKWYFAFHPAHSVQHNLLREFAEVRRGDIQEADNLLQDVWVARKAQEDSAEAGIRPDEGNGA